MLAYLGDSVTTDHISPAGSFSRSTPAGKYLENLGVDPKDFNSYGARRGNHEVMVRGTFANVRLKNFLVPGIEGGVTVHFGKDSSQNKQTSIYEASMQYQADECAASGDRGQGIRHGFLARLGGERTEAPGHSRGHRRKLRADSPLEPGGHGYSAAAVHGGPERAVAGLTGTETYDIEGIASVTPGAQVTVKARAADGSEKTFKTLCRIDTPNELEYFRHGGILPYVLRQALEKA